MRPLPAYDRTRRPVVYMLPVLPFDLAVIIIYFGKTPPWLPITLASMAANGPRVSFSVVGDLAAPKEAADLVACAEALEQ